MFEARAGALAAGTSALGVEIGAAEAGIGAPGAGRRSALGVRSTSAPRGGAHSALRARAHGYEESRATIHARRDGAKLVNVLEIGYSDGSSVPKHELQSSMKRS